MKASLFYHLANLIIFVFGTIHFMGHGDHIVALAFYLAAVSEVICINKERIK